MGVKTMDGLNQLARCQFYKAKKSVTLNEQRFFVFGADGQTRTGTGLPTTPSRWRVYQFHHIGLEGIVPSLILVRLMSILQA